MTSLDRHGPDAFERPRRVLYVQRPRGGGSIESLLEMVRALDRTRYEPVLLVYEPDSDTGRFTELDIPAYGLWDILARPRGRDFRVSAAAPADDGAPAPPTDRLPDHGVIPAPRSTTRIAWRLSRWMSASAIDLVHHNNNLRANRTSILAARMAGVPQVCHVRMLKRYSKVTDRGAARLIDRFVYISTAVERQILRQLGVPRSRGRVIHDPVDVDAFAAAASERDRVRRELGVDDGEPLIVNPGRIVRWKGQDHFLRALAIVIGNHPTARGLVIGAPDGRPESRAYFDELVDLARRLGVADRIRFTGFRRDIAELLAASDVVVHSSSRAEPLGRVVLEGMAAARPVVATAAGGPLDLVVDGETGLLVPPADADRMAAAIDRLLTDRAQARNIGRTAREHARRRFEPGQYVAAVQEIYRSLLRPAAATI